MKKKTIDHPDDLKRLEKGSSTTAIPTGRRHSRPRVPLMGLGLGEATIAENVDALLDEKVGDPLPK